MAAQKAGAKQVQVNLSGGTSIIIPLVPDDDKPVDDSNEWLTDVCGALEERAGHMAGANDALP